MDNLNFSKLMLKTVFSFMTCDGHIANQEISFIKNLSKEEGLFSDLDLDKELAKMFKSINTRGLDFFDDYFKKITRAELTEEQELQILDAAIKTINADDEVKQEEINFLKILRTVLKAPDQSILDKFPKLAGKFIHKDNFTKIYIKELYTNYFKKQELPQFDLTEVTDITDSVQFDDK